MSGLIPPSLAAALRHQVRESRSDDRLLLAKLITASHQSPCLYLIDINDTIDGTWITCFDPTVEDGYPTLRVDWLEGKARLCPVFQPTMLSHLAPDWWRQARQEQEVYRDLSHLDASGEAADRDFRRRMETVQFVLDGIGLINGDDTHRDSPAIIDLLSDLRHYCRQFHLDFTELYDLARSRYLNEQD